MISNPSIRAIEPDSDEEVALVARRMRDTLSEVLGFDRGTTMYTRQWLEERVRWHLDPNQVIGQVLVAQFDDAIVGHTIVRCVDPAEDDPASTEARHGLFATVYVQPHMRRHAIAQALVARGESWIRSHRLKHAVTYTDPDNIKLIALFRKHGYQLLPSPRPDMVMLRRQLDAAG